MCQRAAPSRSTRWRHCGSTDHGPRWFRLRYGAQRSITSSKHDLARELNRPRRTRRAERAEIAVGLEPRRVEACGCKQARELRVVPGVEELGPEHQEASFAKQRKALAQRDVPVFGPGSAQDPHPGVAEGAPRGSLECFSSE